MIDSTYIAIPYRVDLALQWARYRLERSPSASLDAQLLLGFVLGTSRAWVLSHPDVALDHEEWRLFERLTERRCQGEPMAYIRGQVEWCGMNLEVNPSILIPRPETELVAEEAVRMAREMKARVCADVGTGSGAIAIRLAHELPQCLVYGLDISEPALALAIRNAAKQGVSGRIVFHQGSLLEKLTFCPDLVVANLPYLSDSMMQELPRAVRYEPAGALHGGHNGLELYIDMFSQMADRSWAPHMVLEIDPRESHEMIDLVKHYFPKAQRAVRTDYAGLDRFVVVNNKAADE